MFMLLCTAVAISFYIYFHFFHLTFLSLEHGWGLLTTRFPSELHNSCSKLAAMSSESWKLFVPCRDFIVVKKYKERHPQRSSTVHWRKEVVKHGCYGNMITESRKRRSSRSPVLGQEAVYVVSYCSFLLLPDCEVQSSFLGRICLLRFTSWGFNMPLKCWPSLHPCKVWLSILLTCLACQPALAMFVRSNQTKGLTSASMKNNEQVYIPEKLSTRLAHGAV